MTNSEMERVISKLVSVTEFLAEEVADLVDGKSSRDNAQALYERAEGIRKAALELRVTFDEFD
jgi:hypothetical protein